MTNLIFELIDSRGKTFLSGTMTDISEWLHAPMMQRTGMADRMLRYMADESIVDLDLCPIMYIMDGEREVSTLDQALTLQFFGQLPVPTLPEYPMERLRRVLGG